MKGLILAAGSGSRLRPITYTRAKPCIPIANKMILHFPIALLLDCGIKEIGIVVSQNSEEIEARIHEYRRKYYGGVNFTFIKQEVPLGLAHAVRVSERFTGKSPFVMVLGDNVLEEGIDGYVDRFRKERFNAGLLLKEVDDPRAFGVATVEGEKVLALEEKPAHPKSNLALIGTYLFDENIFDAVKEIKPSRRGEFEITDAIQVMIEKGLDVRAWRISGWWKDTGKLEDLLDANSHLLRKLRNHNDGKIMSSTLVPPVEVGRATVIKDSQITGPVIIGDNSYIESSVIGPNTSIGDNVRLVNARIEESIVMDECIIQDCSRVIRRSLFGTQSIVSRSMAKGKKGLMLFLGDKSEVWL